MLKNFNDFRAKFEYFKKFVLTGFQKSILSSISISAIISHPHVLIGYYHLLSDAFQNKAIFAGLCKI